MLNCNLPLLANTSHRNSALQRSERAEQSSGLKFTASPISGNLAREQISALKSMEIRLFSASASFITLMPDSHDSLLLAYCLRVLDENTFAEGLPRVPIVAFTNEPPRRRSAVFDGVRAEQNSNVRSSSQYQRLIMSGGKAFRMGV
jgi:hypothetical protein